MAGISGKKARRRSNTFVNRPKTHCSVPEKLNHRKCEVDFLEIKINTQEVKKN